MNANRHGKTVVIGKNHNQHEKQHEKAEYNKVKITGEKRGRD